VDYTFAQVSVTEALVDYRGNCGNCTSAVGPFAIDERLVPALEPLTTVRLHNTNTRKLVIARVPVEGKEAAVEGDFEMPGVPGRGAGIALDFLDPGGAATGRLLPTGRARDRLDVSRFGAIEASLVDATNPVVFVRASDLGLLGTESPEAMDRDAELGSRLEAIRVAGAALMGIPGSQAIPKVALVAPPAPFKALDGQELAASEMDLVGRVISMGRCHRAFALTAAMCLAVAARVAGTVVWESLSPGGGEGLGEGRLHRPTRAVSTSMRAVRAGAMVSVRLAARGHRTASEATPGRGSAARATSVRP
jgi:hypothetical protein